jgi:hypothetical protein
VRNKSLKQPPAQAQRKLTFLAKGENPHQASVQNENDPDVLNSQPSEMVSSCQFFFH